MQQSKKVNVRYITFTAVMAALVFVFTFTFKIPLGTGYTHLGDMMIFLAAWLPPMLVTLDGIVTLVKLVQP